MIVGEVDAAIEKLQRIRAILGRLLTPNFQTIAKPLRAHTKRLPQIKLLPEPRAVVLPPKQRREHLRTPQLLELR